MPPAHPDFADGVFQEDGDEIRALSGGEGREIFHRRCYSQGRESTRGKRFQDLLLKRGDDILSISDFNEILLTAVRHGEPDSAELLFSELPAYGLSPNCWTFSIMIQHLCKENEPERAKEFSDEMIRSGLPPLLQSAYELFKAMGRVGCSPTIQTYNCLLNGLCYTAPRPHHLLYPAAGAPEIGELPTALKIHAEMREAGLKAETRVMNSLLRGACRRSTSDPGFLEEVERLSEEIVELGGHCISPYTYCLMVQAFVNGRRSDKALTHLVEMERMGSLPGRENGRCCAGSGDDDQGEEDSKLLRLREAARRVESAGRFLDACSVYAVAVKKGVRLCRQPRKTL
ncbi:unnamed protein product [Spirodela intermedia]|uniref:Uncharacterized protein n=1 Tax=Spirodela intermedia TaxID=51605 RepID=A0A7I8JSQ1_SPIIN|nr:unnamed protein product [Spirodela intermedia]CAA6673227.1 unnamed protein product [Spirodela intermedia]